MLAFSIPHVFKALQLLKKDKFVSRSRFVKEIHLGEGAVRILISHLKEAGMIDSTKSGRFLTNKGNIISNQIQEVISNECTIKNVN